MAGRCFEEATFSPVTDGKTVFKRTAFKNLNAVSILYFIEPLNTRTILGQRKPRETVMLSTELGQEVRNGGRSVGLSAINR